MNKSLKGTAIVAAAMLVVGLVIAGIGYMAGGNQPIHFDRKGIHVGNEGETTNGKMDSLTEKLDSFSSISTDLDYSDVELIPSDKYAIEANFSSEYGKPNFKVENGTLTVKDGNHKKFNVNIDIFGFFTSENEMSVKIYYPKDAKLKDVVIKGGSSDLSFENLTAEKAEFDLDFGKLELSDLSAKNIKVSMDSGDCSMSNITADDLAVSNDLGKTTLDGAKLKTLELKADSGDVSITGVSMDYGDLKLDLGKLTAKEVSSKGLKVENDSGDINLQGTLLGTTDINCDMGKVTVNPGASKDQFNYDLDADLGSVSIGEDKASGSLSLSNGAKNTMKITSNMGDINVNF